MFWPAYLLIALPVLIIGTIVVRKTMIDAAHQASIAPTVEERDLLGRKKVAAQPFIAVEDQPGWLEYANQWVLSQNSPQ